MAPTLMTTAGRCQAKSQPYGNLGAARPAGDGGERRHRALTDEGPADELPAMDATPVAPVDSATVIVLRRRRGGECEVLLVERHAQSRAFAGASVFPGGVLDPADAAPSVQSASRNVTPSAAAARLGEDVPPTAALAFWIAAVRELFEETGVLLAEAGGTSAAASTVAVRERMRQRRAALLSGALTFADLVAEEQLVIATDRLRYFCRWITPVAAPRRYDARFFVAELSDGQEPLHDERETIATVWISPADAIARAEAGTMVLAPPTLRTLEELRDLGTVDAILAAADRRRVTPILPKVTTIDGAPAILYPADSEYESIDASDASTRWRSASKDPAIYPRSTSPPDDPTSAPRDRVLLQNGVWRSVRTRGTR